MNKAFNDKCSIVANNTSQRSQVLGNLRVAFMWHRNTADRARCESFTDLANLSALQGVDFVPNLVAGGGDQGEQVEPLSQYITRSCPGNCRCLQAQLLQKGFLHFYRTWPNRREDA